ncbi:MAG: hypothetical protein IT495_20510 [Gammaproteobacteria bacterium]|nr:hypothetical protein [Gammaproteobacteria bacterium]
MTDVTDTAPAANPRLAQRQERIQRAIRLQPVEQVPTAYMGIAFAPRYMGMSMAQFCRSPQDRIDVTLAAMDRLGSDLLDGINSLPAGSITAGLSSLWLSRVAVPGRELPDDSLWQVQEAEIMTVEDYDTIIDQGWPAFVRQYMPRVIDPAELAANRDWCITHVAGVVQRFRDRGYVPISFGGAAVPFEALCGARSMQRFFVDLYRIPDKVQAAMDVMQPHMIGMGLASAQLSGIQAVWVGGWRTASALISPKLWDRFVFPYLLELVNALAAQGIVSVLHFDQDWTRDLPRLLELPARMCLLNLDGMTDIRKAKAVLGEHMALMGDVPSTLLAAGTPEQVRTYVRDLIRDVGPTGLILCPGCDAPINARPQNMEAFVQASRDFGAS